VVLSMSSMHSQSNRRFATAGAQLRTVTQLTSLRSRCRTRAARRLNLNLLTAHDLHRFQGIDRHGFAVRSLHFRWKCVTKATPWLELGAQLCRSHGVVCRLSTKTTMRSGGCVTRGSGYGLRYSINCWGAAKCCCTRTTISGAVCWRLAWNAPSIWWGAVTYGIDAMSTH